MPISSPIAKYHLIEVTLATRIREGAYDDGGLPGERALAAEFEVARVTIRNALQRLGDQGLVVRRQRRGTAAISGLGAPAQPKLLRYDLDRFLDRGRKDKRKVIRFGFVPASALVATALSVALNELVLRVVRVRSDGATPLTYTEVFVLKRLSPGISRTALERKAFVQVLEESGVKIGTAEQSISSVGAPPPVSAALGVALHSPVLKLTRVIHDQTGLPVQLLLGWYRADRFEVRMRLSRADDTTKVWVEYR